MEEGCFEQKIIFLAEGYFWKRVIFGGRLVDSAGAAPRDFVVAAEGPPREAACAEDPAPADEPLEGDVLLRSSKLVSIKLVSAS